MPSYPTLRRFMKANGLDKRRRVTSRQTDGADRAEERLADREIRGSDAVAEHQLDMLDVGDLLGKIALAGNADEAAEKVAEPCEQGPQLARHYDSQSVADHIPRLVGGARSRSGVEGGRSALGPLPSGVARTMI